MLNILDEVSAPGNPARPNDDRMGHNAACVFVIDGASGLGDRVVMAGTGSDAAWLAEQARLVFEQGVTPQTDLAALIAGLSDAVRATFERAGGAIVPRYAWPSASFAMLRQAGEAWHFAGLGDCSLFLRSPDGTISRYSVLGEVRGAEQDGARRYLALTGGFGKTASYHDQPETLAALRAARAQQNTQESGVWTLGLVAEAAAHVASVPVDIAGPTTGLVCTDGFADLIDSYARYTPGALIQSALENGLKPLLAEIRAIERRVDPDGHLYPRFKQSDDATAVLFSLGPEA